MVTPVISRLLSLLLLPIFIRCAGSELEVKKHKCASEIFTRYRHSPVPGLTKSLLVLPVTHSPFKSPFSKGNSKNDLFYQEAADSWPPLFFLYRKQKLFFGYGQDFLGYVKKKNIDLFSYVDTFQQNMAHKAAICGDYRLFKHLVAKQLDTLKETEPGKKIRSPLCKLEEKERALAMQELKNTAKRLLKELDDFLDQEDGNKQTPLHLACKNLLRKGTGKTSFIGGYPVNCNRFKIILFLLKHQAKYHALDKFKKSPLDYLTYALTGKSTTNLATQSITANYAKKLTTKIIEALANEFSPLGELLRNQTMKTTAKRP